MPYRPFIDSEIYKDDNHSPFVTYGTDGVETIRWMSTPGGSLYDMTVADDGTVTTTAVVITSSALLLETGFYLLLETGDKLLLE